MEHAKKMFLIKPEIFQKLKETGETFPDTISQLDNEMHHVLKEQTDDREKWNKYQQVLQRYLHFSNNLREPVTIPIADLPEEKDVTDAQKLNEKQPIEDILESVPKNLRNKSKLLLQQINKNNIIKWDDNGQVSVNNQTVVGSNIIDLVNDVIRIRKPTNPKGIDVFLDGLAQINIPIEFLGNEAYRNYFKAQSRIVTSTPKTNKKRSAPVKFSQPTSGYDADVERNDLRHSKKKKKNQSITDLDWEKF